MVTVILQHQVQDFATWKPVYDSDESNRLDAGIKEIGLYTSVTDPNDVTMMFEASDPSVLEAFMSDPRLKETMQKAGVTSAPAVRVLSKM